MAQPITQKVPASALRFACEAFKFGDPNLDGADKDLGDKHQPAKAPISLFVRSSKPIDHFYWGQCVHDMGGVGHKDKVPLDYMHGSEVLGYADTFDIGDEGLTISGFITPFKEDDRASEVLAKAKAGVPWEGSVNFAGGNLKIQKLKEGQYAQVNGYLMQGPGTIFREWTLRGAAVCPYGADSDTQAQFAAGDEVAVEIVEGPLAEAPASTQDSVLSTQPPPAAGTVAPPAASQLAAVTPAAPAPSQPVHQVDHVPAAATNLVAPAEVPVAEAASGTVPAVSPVPADTGKNADGGHVDPTAAWSDFRKVMQFTAAEDTVDLQYALKNLKSMLSYLEWDIGRCMAACVAYSGELDEETAHIANHCAAECRENAGRLAKCADCCDELTKEEPEGSVLENGAGTVLPESSLSAPATAVPQPDNPPAQVPAPAVIASIPAKGPATDPPPATPLNPPAPPATTQSIPAGVKQFKSWALGSPYWVSEPGKEPWECVMRGTSPDGRNLFVTKPGDPPMVTHNVPETWLSAAKPEPAAAPIPNPQSPIPSPDGKAFIAAFGETKGAKWFAEGVSFDAAKDLFIADLRTENTTLTKRLTAVAGGEEQPVSFQPTDPDHRGGMTPAMTQLANNQGENIARIAAGIAAMSPGVFRAAR